MNGVNSFPASYPYLRIGYLTAPGRGERPWLLEGIGTPVVLDQADLPYVLKLGLDLVLVESSGLDSAESLDTLIACEGAGIPTVLHALQVADLSSSIAAVVSHIVTTDPAVYRAALTQVGAERALLVKPVVDPRAVLMSGTDSTDGLTPEAITERRNVIEEQSPKAQADALAALLGFTVEPPPLVTAIVVSRKAENLDGTLENLKRQQYPRIDVLLTVDPLYEQAAREATERWDIPLRIVTAQPGSTLADRLNLGVYYAHGELVTMIEENALYGSHHIIDLVQAIQHTAALLVGKASWHVYDEAKRDMVIRAPGLQRSYGETPALGTMMLRREIAQHFGFTRRASGINWPLAERLADTADALYSIHAYDTVLLRKGQTLDKLSTGARHSSAFPFQQL